MANKDIQKGFRLIGSDCVDIILYYYKDIRKIHNRKKNKKKKLRKKKKIFVCSLKNNMNWR